MASCTYCGTEGPTEVEHVEPLSRGGTDTPDNRVLACFRCNRAKGNQFPLEWVWGIQRSKRPNRWAKREGERLLRANPDMPFSDFAKALRLSANNARPIFIFCHGGRGEYEKRLQSGSPARTQGGP